MRFSSFTYLVGQGLHNLRANRLMTFASMGVLTVCMLLIGAAYLLGVNIDAMVEYIGDQNETVVYMDQGASDDQIAAADTAIRSTEHGRCHGRGRWRQSCRRVGSPPGQAAPPAGGVPYCQCEPHRPYGCWTVPS